MEQARNNQKEQEALKKARLALGSFRKTNAAKSKAEDEAKERRETEEIATKS